MKRMTASLAVFLTACSGDPAPSVPDPVTIFAAASATDAVETVARAFGEARGVRVRTSFAGSSTLARQIEAGADADLFLSAGEEWADYVASRLPVAARRNLLANRLVAVVPTRSSLRIAGPEDLLAPEVQRIAIADPEAVPAGIYARRALERLALWDRLKDRLVPAADVRQALLYVERDEADVGFVYATDAAIGQDVRTVLQLDPAEPILYPLLLLNDDPDTRRFYDYLDSPQAARIYRRLGFEKPEPLP